VFVIKLRGKIIDRKKNSEEERKSKDCKRRTKEERDKYKISSNLAPDLCLSPYVVHLNKKYK
jgi:hypothetical protein